ncbi:creatininase family protein, partial [Candidatus Woesearchaeota archaeon]|nr:creatininase family protein [Candidatus Woesearchaeota archaeon]
GHACELETSIMLSIRPDLVKMKKAKKDTNYPNDGDLFMDWSDGALSFMPYWSTISKTGTAGDPTVATKKAGEYLVKVAVEELCDRVKILRKLDYEKYSKRIDHHLRI